MLYVTELRKKLLIVSKMENAGLKVIFGKGKVKVYTQNFLLLIGNNIGTLYTVKFNSDVIKYCDFICKTKHEDIDLWHRRLVIWVIQI